MDTSSSFKEARYLIRTACDGDITWMNFEKSAACDARIQSTKLACVIVGSNPGFPFRARRVGNGTE